MSPETTTQRLRVTCPHDCPDTCGMIVELDATGRASGLRGDHAHPLTSGWLCTKIRDYLEWVEHDERVLHPLRRVGKKGAGQFEQMSWESALEEIAARWRDILTEHGGAAILPYSYSGTLGLLQMGVTSQRLWRRIGASGLERSICGAAAKAAVLATVGARWAPDPEQLAQSRLIVLWGHDPRSTSPHLMPILARARRAGCKVVVIDPRRSGSAKLADLHLAPRPATDGALALGLMHVLANEQLVDQTWLARHSVGSAELLARARRFDPARVAAITGLSKQQIIDLAQLYGRTRPALIKIADGLQRHGNGGQTVRAIACLPALVGQYGERGGGLFYATSDHLHWHDETLTRASACPPIPRVVNMNRLGAALTGELEAPPIRALYVFGANPAASAPNAGLIARGLARDDLFTVVHELFLTDTARWADIVLPATSQLEQLDLHTAYGHRFLSLSRPVIAPCGEARSNWDTSCALAAALGFDEPWLRDDAETVLRELFEATRREQSALRDIDWATLERDGWAKLNAADVPFSDGRFPTPSGKVELYSAALEAEGHDPLPDGSLPAELSDAGPQTPDPATSPLALISSATHHFVSSSLYALERLRRLEGPPHIALNPKDAAARGIEDGATVRVRNSRGELFLTARLDDGLRPGVASSPKGHWAYRAADGKNVNWTTSDALGDFSGQSTFHTNLVWVERP